MNATIDPARIDWQRVCLNLRTHYGPLSRVATEVGADAMTLQRMARGETSEPKFAAGVQLLDLHYAYCRELHGPTIIKGR